MEYTWTLLITALVILAIAAVGYMRRARPVKRGVVKGMHVKGPSLVFHFYPLFHLSNTSWLGFSSDVHIPHQIYLWH